MKRKFIILLSLMLVIAATGVSAESGAIAASDKVVTSNADDAQETLATVKDGKSSCTVTASGLNLRQGPGKTYKVIKVLKKGQTLQLIGTMGKWSAVYDPKNGLIGAVDSKYLKTAAFNEDSTAASTVPTDISTDEQALLDLVNKARVEAGVGTLSFDKALLDTARLKAKDMTDNSYFSHQSPTYGSPFDMMRQYGLEFKAAGENIAGNETVEGAFEAWMSSDGHKKNILNSNFNYIGIGVASSKTYGKVFVQQFIGK